MAAMMSSTGSFLGAAGYGDVPASIPVGYETVIAMHPLGFEEFLLAHEITEPMIALLRNCPAEEEPAPAASDAHMRNLLLECAVLGGMPDAVQSFADNHDMGKALQIQRDTVRAYEDDRVKHAPSADKPLIKQRFQPILRQLAKKNKEFQYALIKKGSAASRFSGSLQWIVDSGIMVRCRNLAAAELPFDGSVIDNQFKVYGEHGTVWKMGPSAIFSQATCWAITVPSMRTS